MDPPWLERGGGKIKRGADRHYALMKTPDILGYLLTLQVQQIWRPHEDSHLYIWVTNNFFKDGLWVMENLGYRFIHPITWAKTRTGLGQYRRGQTEHLLFGVRGNAQVPATKARTTTLLGGQPIAPTGHSVKPEEQYDDIESVSPGPYIELFARHVCPGWFAHGRLKGEDRKEYLLYCDKKGKIKEVMA
jgi:N6-adenosine-specific RNA methylase IME4